MNETDNHKFIDIRNGIVKMLNIKNLDKKNG